MDEWWKNRIGYQIYIKSFCDGNNDGFGDLKGITSKLDYLKSLGIGYIWICPFYDSPMDDNGYDIRDYYKIDEIYGNIDDLKELIKKAHKNDIKVLIDLIVNHTSIENDWFIKSREKIEPYTDFYIWKNGKKTKNNNILPPNNWQSFFSGSAWNYDSKRKQFYLSIFSTKMADLNYENKNVVEEIKNIINFYSNLDIDGFRVDAVSHIGKDTCFKNVVNRKKTYKSFSNQQKTHDYLKHLNKIFKKNKLITMGELGGNPNKNDIIKYFNNELDVCFTFEHINCFNEKLHKINLKKLKNTLIFKNDITKKGGCPALFWFNHDYPRLISEVCNELDSKNASICLAILMYFLKGSPIIYNGEEIGMTNYNFSSSDDFDDVKSKMIINNSIDKQKAFLKVKQTSRDNARTIMQWNNTKYSGFSNCKPWFILNDNYKNINVSTEEKDKNSLLNTYKKFIKLRNSMSNVINNAQYNFFLKNKTIGYFIQNKKEKYLIEANFSNKIKKLPIGKILFSNKEITNQLKYFEVVVMKLN